MAAPDFLDGPVIRSEFRVSAIRDKEIRDILRRACKDAAHGPVWVMGAAENCLGVIVSPEDAAFLREMRRRVHGSEDSA
jgi:hypothetical protein